MRTDAPALVVGAGINGLGVARSLTRMQIPVYVADVDPHQPAMSTRGATPIRIGSLHGEALIDALVQLGETCFAKRRPVLLLTQEESVKWVSQERTRLAPLYRFTLPPAAMVDALLSKYGFQQLAEREGAPIPPLVRVTCEADLPVLSKLHYPVVVKPAERNAEYSRSFKKAYRIQSAVEAIGLVRRMLPAMPDIVVQEWTEGPDSSVHFCLQYIDGRGRTAASFTGRKIRSWPPQVGGTASCAPAPDADSALSELTTRFFRAAGVVGMAAMEYKRDVRSGEFRMVEPTIGRTDYQAEVATLNGVNLPYAAYCAELGELVELAVPATAASSARRLAWRVRSEDQQSAIAQRQGASDGFADVDGVVDALWRASDPRPWLAQNWRHAMHAIGARIGRKASSSVLAGDKA